MKTKADIYEAIYKLNLDFQHVMSAMDKLRELEVFPESFVNFAGNRLEELRAVINHRFVDVLNHIEAEDAYRFEKMARAHGDSDGAVSAAPTPEQQGKTE